MVIERIKVLVVDDSKLASEIMAQIIKSDPALDLVGVAHDGKEAVGMVEKMQPNIITMDLKMPIMDGYETVKQIMAYHPTPILIVTASYVKGDTAKAFKAISIGALDIMDKSVLDAWSDPARSAEVADFISTLKFLSRVRVAPHILGKTEKIKIAAGGKTGLAANIRNIVGMTASTGGPQALLEILKQLPGDLPAAILIVQHITQGFEIGMVDWMKEQCKLPIKVPSDNEEIKMSQVYVAPSNLHMTVDTAGKIKLVDGPPVNGIKPSGTVLFESIARVFGGRAIGVILTGMGGDGALGIKAIKEAGGFTLAQNEETSVVFGMPQVAIQLGKVDEVLALENIAGEIMKRLAQ